MDIYDKDVLGQIDERIQNAVSNAQVGFHFEEGGCWGFALALQEVFVEQGLHATLVVRDHDFIHAWTKCGGEAWDHQGWLFSRSGGEDVYKWKLLELAQKNGVSEEQVESDRQMAKDILRTYFLYLPRVLPVECVLNVATIRAMNTYTYLPRTARCKAF